MSLHTKDALSALARSCVGSRRRRCRAPSSCLTCRQRPVSWTKRWNPKKPSRPRLIASDRSVSVRTLACLTESAAPAREDPEFQRRICATHALFLSHAFAQAARTTLPRRPRENVTKYDYLASQAFSPTVRALYFVEDVAPCAHPPFSDILLGWRRRRLYLPRIPTLSASDLDGLRIIRAKRRLRGDDRTGIDRRFVDDVPADDLCASARAYSTLLLDRRSCPSTPWKAPACTRL